MYCFIDSFFFLAILEQWITLLEGVLKIIFEELDPFWLALMWRGASKSRRNARYYLYALSS